ncbi:MAG TPA: alpha/beta fold hydrolase [Promineifilum sp.]|nr:alpha/beta fold hydrolase [Promineifilum sp.]
MRFLLILSLALLAACTTRGPVAEVAGVTPPSTQRRAAAATPTLTATATSTATPSPALTPTPSPTATATETPSPAPTPEHPLMVEVMRRRDYPPIPLTIEQTLDPGDNYDRYIASYQSDGHTIHALLTVPNGRRPDSGWPIIVFNHGYIAPEDYRTTERYVQYVDYFARSGYIVFRSDYRGHGSSEGEARGPYSNPDYVIDVLNGMAAVRTHPDADPERVGMWGHSMGGYITLRAMVVSDEIDAGVIWGGVVAPYPDLFNRAGALATAVAADAPAVTATAAAAQATTAAAQATATARALEGTPAFRFGRWRSSLIDTYGTPEENPAFWDSISSNAYLADISGPLQLHHAITDETVPAAASVMLHDQMTALGLPVELYLYDNDSHDIDNNFYTAMRRSLEFFDLYVKAVTE